MINTINGFTGYYRFLSNLYIHEIEYRGRKYQTNEHLYQSLKATDKEDHELVRNALTAGKAKQLGQIIEKRPDWQFVNLEIMKEINRIKFSDPQLREKLLNTGDALLTESNFWCDTFFGKCTCAKRGHKNEGENWLGVILMNIRTELKNTENKA